LYGGLGWSSGRVLELEGVGTQVVELTEAVGVLDILVRRCPDPFPAERARRGEIAAVAHRCAGSEERDEAHAVRPGS
jgi:hypothetical protein